MRFGSGRRGLWGRLGALTALLFWGLAPAQGWSQAGEDADLYRRTIAPIFEAKCIACHSCYNAPCQLNLQAYSGASRGAARLNVYDATRLESVAPTRVDIDAQSLDGWRRLGFFDVLGDGDPAQSLLLALTRLRREHSGLQPSEPVAESLICPPNRAAIAEDDAGDAQIAALGMPYGLPPLTGDEIGAIEGWIAKGAPGPTFDPKAERAAIPQALLPGVQAWEAFLNADDPRQRLVSRYLYEHLFLAHLHFGAPDAEEPPAFFRLVRSRTACDDGVEEIATRRPTDPPGVEAMSYCLRPMNGAIVEKTHIPYALSDAKLARLRSLFLESDWEAPPAPAYASDQANNPFETFAAIPVAARYQFLLDDAQYHVATFIKGPVCNGSTAVNSIQEQFFVFFLKPEADGMVVSPAFERAAREKLILPGAWGSDIELIQDLPFFDRIVEYREDYRKLRAESVRRLRPNGYALDDIWDGDGGNPNAVLTVFRHDDNAAVVKGAVGDLPKTAFVMDYALFERLVYNLVVNFDVFGNVGHQVLTRVYMDLIRMEAEELFLAFLPPKDRLRLRHAWYEGGLLTDIKVRIIFPLINQALPTAVRYRVDVSESPGEARREHRHGSDDAAARKRELVERLLFERMSAETRGPSDPINWRRIEDKEARKPTGVEATLRGLASLPAVGATPFARFFPDLALIHLTRPDGGAEIYSIIHHREHDNVSWIMGEALRLKPEEDSLSIVRGVLGAYPNMLFDLAAGELPAFVEAARRIASEEDYAALVERFGLRRSDPRFWEVFGAVNAIAREERPIDRGVLDLTRYVLEGD